MRTDIVGVWCPDCNTVHGLDKLQVVKDDTEYVEYRCGNPDFGFLNLTLLITREDADDQ